MMRTLYHIRVASLLDPLWSGALDGMTIAPTPNGCDETVLSGWLQDQAQLIGILNRVHALNLTLVAVTRIENQAERKDS